LTGDQLRGAGGVSSSNDGGRGARIGCAAGRALATADGLQVGFGSSANTCFKRVPHVLRIIVMYWFDASICTNLVTASASASRPCG
jgi:hypothetical protein